MPGRFESVTGNRNNMRQLFLLICLILGSSTVWSQEISSYNADQLVSRISRGDTVYIVNFWATWCAPCVKELPVFDTLQERYKNQPVKVLLVSLDFSDDYEEKITRFVERKKPRPEIIWFAESNANLFIPKIDDRWSGALPATMIIRGTQREFLEQTVSVDDITDIADHWLGKSGN